MEAAVLQESRPDPHVLLAVLNRPDARNAVDPALARALGALVRRAEDDDAVRVVVLTGAGAAFCAGADLKAVSQGLGPALSDEEAGFAGFVHARRTKPWIAAVNGPALAGGTEIALACDLIVASGEATFGLPEVRHGLIASAGGLYRLPRALPRALAIEAILTGCPFTARVAHEHGMVNRLVEPARVVEAALELAGQIARNAPVAVRESLALARLAQDLDDAGLRRLSEAARDRIRLTEDFREGPRAFVQKRAPVWKGR